MLAPLSHSNVPQPLLMFAVLIGLLEPGSQLIQKGIQLLLSRASITQNKDVRR